MFHIIFLLLLLKVDIRKYIHTRLKTWFESHSQIGPENLTCGNHLHVSKPELKRDRNHSTMREVAF